MLSDYDNISIVIRSFGNRLAEDLFHDRVTGATRRFPPDLKRAAQRKLQYLNAAVRLHDLAVPPGNRLEGLRGDRRGFHAIRINDQWRIVFRWDDDGVSGVEVTDYH
jgi:proteic killer suppression protein